ncbi:MAG: FliH/SctL family protein [Christensenellales bacterium]
MFKIDKSSVEYIDSNKSIVIIKQWVPKENIKSALDGEQFTDNDEKADSLSKEKPAELIMRAKQEANHIISKAVSETNEIKKAAWQEGYALGIQEANKKLQALQEENTNKLNQLICELMEDQKQIEQEMEKNILQLSLDIAEKIVNIQLERDDIVFIEMVKQAINRLNVKEGFRLRLNQREYDKHFQKGHEWLQNELHCPPFSIIKDTAVLPGGCVFELNDGVVKAGADAQIKMISIALNQDDGQLRDNQYDKAL